MADLLYTIEKKEELRRLTKAGEVETFYRVWATTKSGTYFHVDLSEDELTKAKADKIIGTKAQQLDAI